MPQETSKKPVTTEAPLNIDEHVRRRAYELYEARGKEDGHDVEDWLRAEEEVAPKEKQVAA